MAIGGKVGALLIAGGVDVRAEVLRRAPGAVEAVTLRDPQIQAAETACPIRSKVKTETSL